MTCVLISPEKSATLLIDIESIGKGEAYRLSGPGIKESTDIQLSFPSSWFALRNEVCKEFPLGIDLILTDKEKDRKSTRLNSSHVSISYAVFCLKKKKR